ncbi:MAG TPA: chemotaxis protein CheD [Rhizomicrobium sp.]
MIHAAAHTLPRRFVNPQDGHVHVQVIQGETYVTGDACEVLTTVLGSCIAACIRDPLAKVGGMNHFLLAHGRAGDANATRYGVNAMEILINGLLQRGALRARLQAKLFGGASVIAGLSDVGAGNAAFAEKFLADEGIALVGGDVGGSRARRVQFWPVSGRARLLAAPGARTLVERELAAARTTLERERREPHDVELF